MSAYQDYMEVFTRAAIAMGTIKSALSVFNYDGLMTDDEFEKCYAKLYAVSKTLEKIVIPHNI